MDATPSTYCLVASSKLLVGSWVTVTVVRPPSVRLEAPREMAVVPTVIDELTRLAFAMLLSVLFVPLIVLLVSVWVPVSVATVLSIAIVTGLDPL